MQSLLVNIDVNDLERAIDFYTEAFNLTIGRRFGTDGVELLGLSSPLYLLLKEAGSFPFEGASEPRCYSRHWSPIHLDIVVDSIDDSVRRAKLAGAIQEGETRTAKWGKIALFADPFGNGFCILQFIGRGYDEIANPKS